MSKDDHFYFCGKEFFIPFSIDDVYTSNKKNDLRGLSDIVIYMGRSLVLGHTHHDHATKLLCGVLISV